MTLTDCLPDIYEALSAAEEEYPDLHGKFDGEQTAKRGKLFTDVRMIAVDWLKIIDDDTVVASFKIAFSSFFHMIQTYNPQLVGVAQVDFSVASDCRLITGVATGITFDLSMYPHSEKVMVEVGCAWCT
jgi:hypothetical protein